MIPASASTQLPKQKPTPALRRVYWETTAGCNLRCIHCRRVDVLDKISPEELTTDQSKSMIDDLALLGKPVLILSGGEPLFRRDIYEIAAYAKSRGLPVALSTNGTLVTEKVALQIKNSGIYYASISLDGVSPATHDIFRGSGNFNRAMQGFLNLKKEGIKVQINFTVTKQNVREVPKMVDLASSLGAQALYLFLLVPVGCGVKIAESQMLTTQEVEEWLAWVAEKEENKSIRKEEPPSGTPIRVQDVAASLSASAPSLKNSLEGAATPPLELRAICAPQFYRVQQQFMQGKSENHQKRLGCLAGINICFISHKGDLFPCGYLPLSAGNVKKSQLSEIWRKSSLFDRLRDYELLMGKCGLCQFKNICGGCRARAYYQYGSELAEEPYCLYEPQ